MISPSMASHIENQRSLLIHQWDGHVNQNFRCNLKAYAPFVCTQVLGSRSFELESQSLGTARVGETREALRVDREPCLPT